MGVLSNKTQWRPTPGYAQAPAPIDHKALLEQRSEENGARIEETAYAELERICALPILHPLTPEEVEAFAAENVLATAFEAGFRPWERQAAGVMAYCQVGGMFGPIGVGDGKTLVTLMIAAEAKKKGLKKILLLVPPNVYSQLWETDIAWARARVPLNVPFHGLGGKSALARRALCRSGKPGVYVMPYSLLSVKDTTEMLESIAPELLICDEAHRLANPQAACTRRWKDYVSKGWKRVGLKKPPEVVVLSGSITDKSVLQYLHLITPALNESSPLPLALHLAIEWASVIDSGVSPAESQAGPIMPLVEWARFNYKNCTVCEGLKVVTLEGKLQGCAACEGSGLEKITEDVTGFRKAFKLRMLSCPGVVSSGDEGIKTSLVLTNRPIENPEAVEGWGELERLTKQLTELWLTPNGDQIAHAIHTFKWRYELSAGFYNELTWPTVEELMEKRQISEGAAEDVLEKAKEHHVADQEYQRALRDWLSRHSRSKLDTPKLVGQDMYLHGAKNVGSDLYDLWRVMKSLDFEGSKKFRNSRAVRVCPYKINRVVEWAQSLNGAGGIVWVMNKAVGRWAYEALVAAGIDALHCPAGDQYNDLLAGPKKLDHKDRVVVASMTAHGEGKNLQHFSEQIFVQWPRNAKRAEQTLGRTHRNGQTADELIVWLMNSNEFDHECFGATLNDSLYIHQTSGPKQKLVYAAYDPKPIVFKPEWLRERGMSNRILTREMRQTLTEKFGDFRR